MNKNLLLLRLHHLLRDLPLPCSGIVQPSFSWLVGAFPGVWCHLGGVGDQLEAGSWQGQCCPTHRGVGASAAPDGNRHFDGSPAPSPLPDGPAVRAQLCSQ